jgi:para-aminobenzoate synthetase/4-amino-4-deoxychorismate lyase
MEIIRELEPDPRFIYTGTMGFMRPGGDCVFNVAIRTLWCQKETGETRMGVGGGITIDSSPEDEYAECLLKSQFLNRQQAKFELLETTLLEQGHYFLLSRHLLRMQQSARYFCFNWRETAVLDALEHIRTAHPKGNWKVRLLSSESGMIRTEVFLLPSSAPTPLIVAMAPLPVNSRDPFLFNKTTHREIYDSQLVTRPECDDLIFWNERGEVCESSIANIVLETDGVKWTPPRSSGLLAGTFRDELIQQGKIQERVITKDELVGLGNFFLINSVQKWIPARLVI